MIRQLYRDINNFIRTSLRSDIKIGHGVALNGSFLAGGNKIHQNTVFVNSRLGRGSYIGTNCNFNGTEIGRYCSIGSYVKVITANHPSRDFVSTHPAFFSLSKQSGFTYTNKQRFQEQKLLDSRNKISVSIGNDVWIGEEVMILGGIKINDGAIIGAKTLVTKDIPPYTIVGGVPGKIIGKRFNEDEIKFLLDFKWWEKDESWIIQHADFFSDIQDFINRASQDMTF